MSWTNYLLYISSIPTDSDSEGAGKKEKIEVKDANDIF